jgi:hypothetical protein
MASTCMTTQQRTVNMSPIKIALLCVCGYFIVDGYNLEMPTSKVQVSVLDETTPDAPSQVLQDQLAPLDSILKESPQDALILGRAFKHWAILIDRNTQIKDLKHFTNRYKNTLIMLFTGSEVQNKYHGRVDKLLNEVFKSNLSYLYDSDGVVTSYEVTPRVKQSLVDWSNAVSWKCYQIFKENLDATATE